ncbi:MAG: hypothetical protein IT293_01215 [Deltaproteobacteria bacterium]|nr:hypothetical protein [Deltaproteobacteria bacterium]
MRWALVAAVAASLTTAAACTPMHSQYAVQRSNLTCDQANRYAFQSMKTLGYTVTTFEPAALGRTGVLRGNKTERESGRPSGADGVVHITCEPTEVRLEAEQDQLLSQDLTFTRGFYLAFTGIADHAASDVAYADEQSGGTAEGGVKFKIQPQLALETKLDFGEDLAAGGVLAVKVTVQNGSKITYTLDPAAIELRPRGGTEKVRQVDVREAAQKIARAAAADLDPGIAGPSAGAIEETLRKRGLPSGTLAPGDHAEGFVYFPTGSYARARATLVDVESGESEGFLVEF